MLSLDRIVTSHEEEPSYRKRRSHKHHKHRHHRHRHSHKRDRKRTRGVEDRVCAVCLEDDLDCVLSPCRHVFHAECISKWVRVNFTCPLCRQEIKNFIPLKSKKSKVLEEFEQLWYEHYHGDKSQQTEESNASSKDVTKSTGIEVDESLLKQPQKQVTVVETQDTVTQVTEEEIVAPISHEKTLLWTQVWEEVLKKCGIAKEKKAASNVSLVDLMGIDPNGYLTKEELHETVDELIWYSQPLFGHQQVAYPQLSRHEPFSSHAHHDTGQMFPNPSDHTKYDAFQEKDVLKDTLLNVRAGLAAGFAASLGNLVTGGALRGVALHQYGTFMRSSFMPHMGQTMPSVALFFTTYEHLKAHAFRTDPQEKSRVHTFGERFVSAGVAGSLASTLTGGRYMLLGMRFGAFFGSFEFFKDICADSIDRSRPLNVAEVATAAGLGGLIASSMYHASTQLVDGIPLVSTDGFSLAFQREVFLNRLLKPQILFRGFSQYLVTFMPSCVACSCAFEFSRRALAQQ